MKFSILKLKFHHGLGHMPLNTLQRAMFREVHSVIGNLDSIAMLVLLMREMLIDDPIQPCKIKSRKVYH